MYNCKKQIQVKIWWNTRLGIFVIDDIAYSHSVNAFVGILKLKEQTWLFTSSSLLFTLRIKKPMDRNVHIYQTESVFGG